MLVFSRLTHCAHYFPPSAPSPVVILETVDRYPELAAALNSIGGKITNEQMRKLNYAVDAEKRDVKEVVREFLAGLSLIDSISSISRKHS